MIDMTVHDIERHLSHIEDSADRKQRIEQLFKEDGTFRKGQTENWYKWLGKGACPTCGAPVQSKEVPDGSK